MEMKLWHYMQLNQCQMYDVIRTTNIARLVCTLNDQPYVTPMHYQWQLEDDVSIFHFASPAHGRRFDMLRENSCVAIEIELPGCTGIDVVIAEGMATVHVSEEEDAAWIAVTVHTMTGRRYFMG